MTPEQFESRMSQAANEMKDAHTLLQRIALIAEGAAKRNAPVKTGNLRRTITSRATAHEAIVGASAHYAVFVHEGTRFMQARPFIKEGIEESRSQIIAEVEKFGGQVLKVVGG